MAIRAGVISALALVVGCGGGLNNELHPTGSTTIVALERDNALVMVNVFEGSITRFDAATNELEELVLGAEPSRIAPFGDHVLVSLRGERRVLVVDVSGPKMKVVEQIRTGAEPFGIVADEHGKRFWVAVSQAGEVVEYDADFAKVRSFNVDNEPRWLALHPSRKALFVVSARGGKAVRIDLRDGSREPLVPPVVTRPVDDGDEVELDHRYTGDPAVTPDGDWLVIPGLHADTTTPVETPETPDEPVENGYGSGNSIGIGRLNPSLLAVPLDRKGQVDPREPVRVIFLAADFDDEVLRSYPTSVTSDPEGGQVVVTMEASQAVIFVDLRPFRGQDEDEGFDPGDREIRDTGFTNVLPSFPPRAGSFTERPVFGVSTQSRGPDGVAFTRTDTAWLHSFIDRTVTALPYIAAEDQLNFTAERQFRMSSDMVTSPGLQVTGISLPPDVQRGLELFYGARDAKMAATGAGVSCSTCHFDGRDDGLTWTFGQGVRQTPSLAGTVSQTFPVTWTDEVDSVATEAMLTSSLRMGGEGLTEVDTASIQAFVDWGRRVDVGPERLDQAAVARGKALFERADVGCAECHGGQRFTDNTSYEMFGLSSVNTPSLTGVAATAPYLHDGSAKTLEDLLLRSAAGLMGDASSLTEAELKDLETYLRSL